MPENQEATLDQLAELIRGCKPAREVCFLWGAGCSASGKVPVASEWVNQLKARYPDLLRRVTRFPDIMAEFGDRSRRDIIETQCSRAKVNAAHLALVELMREDSHFIDCVASVNFDPLVERAAAIAGLEERLVYDLATTHLFDANYVREPALVYLHGRLGGYDHKMTSGATLEQSFASKLFAKYREALWVVIGYGGSPPSCR